MSNDKHECRTKIGIQRSLYQITLFYESYNLISHSHHVIVNGFEPSVGSHLFILETIANDA